MPPGQYSDAALPRAGMGVVGHAMPGNIALGTNLITEQFHDGMKGCIWNCRSLWAREASDTFKFVLQLAAVHDFVILVETRETKTKRQITLAKLPAEFTYFSSRISARRGGIAIIVKNSFLAKFEKSDWTVRCRGRVAQLLLRGTRGQLNIIPTYLDPSSIAEQLEGIKAVEKCFVHGAHNLVAGDFNFATCSGDRIAKGSADLGVWNDKRQMDAWNGVAKQADLKEFEQQHFTCEHSHGWSRIDRVYSTLHASYLLNLTTGCTTVDHPRELSDHSPISFMLRSRASKAANIIPAWVGNHPRFEEEVIASFNFRLNQLNETSPKEVQPQAKINLLKEAIRDAASYVRSLEKDALAETTAHKLACTLAFIRAVGVNDFKAAMKMQSKYARLRQKLDQTTVGSQWYASVKQHAVELMRTDIAERVQELRTCKCQLRSEIYDRKKLSIVRKLKSLLPAGGFHEIVIIKDESGALHTCPEKIAEELRKYWQNVFNKGPTDKNLRRKWLDHVRGKMRVALEELRPNMDDVKVVFENLNDSTPGPDGIPSGIYKCLRNIAPSLFCEFINGIIDGTDQVDEDFNFAIMCCIPKANDDFSDDGVRIHKANATRPISIVDAANRIFAAVLKVALERCVGNKVSKMQRGFLKGRDMLMNLIDVDFAAQCISIRSTRGAIILWDFKSAFPSMDHDFIWDTLDSIGLPSEFVSAIQALYRNNQHRIKLQGRSFPGPEVQSGVRQGCPLSGLLFAICADVLLTRIQSVLTKGHELVRAFADDTAAVVHDYVTTLPVLSILFDEYEQISRLMLNISKTVFIPLWPLSSSRGLRSLIQELCPLWKDIRICSKAKYLGFMIGPDAKNDSWSKPLDKYNQRVAEWENAQCGIFWNSVYYNIFVVTTLEFVAQLADIPDTVMEAERQAMRRMARGPGNWISLEDLEHLSDFGIGGGFRLIYYTHRASKMRLLKELGPRRIRDMEQQLEVEQCNSFARPFGAWHRQSFVTLLRNNERELARAGITIRDLLMETAKGASSFQRKAREQIVKNVSRYDLESRIRHRISRWRFADPPAHVTSRCIRLFEILKKKSSPAVCAGYLRALFNGWPTSARMRNMKGQSGTSACFFGCSARAEDRIEHYACCSMLWKFRETPMPAGPGLRRAHKGINGFFGMIKSMSESERIRAATAVHITGKILMYRRKGLLTEGCDLTQALRMEWRNVAGRIDVQ